MSQMSLQSLDESTPLSRRRVPWFGIFLLLTIIFLAVLYWRQTRLPATVTIAGGPAGGRYAAVAQAMAEELERRLEIDVVVRQTQGSLENLHLLESDAVDFALYQCGTQQTLEGAILGNGLSEPAFFVSNLYSEYLIPFGRVAMPVSELSLNVGRRWSCNDRMSGDFAMTRMLLRHLEIDEAEIEILSVNYADIPKQIASGKIDVAIVCCGLDAAVLHEIAASDATRVVKIPAVSAFVRKQMMLAVDAIPAGMFRTSPMVPAEDFPTVTLQAQLLANRNAPIRLVEEAAAVIADSDFQRRLGLDRLFEGGVEYATARPEFAMHPGASHVFFPELKPLINPDFVEGTEGLRSFLVSLVAAVWLLHRWWTRRQIRGQEHRLDRYIRELLQLERDQMDVDGDGGPDESLTLQSILDKVTILRQEALSEFTAHELNEDNAVDSFIQMCHALSDKVNAKLLRHSILNARPVAQS